MPKARCAFLVHDFARTGPGWVKLVPLNRGSDTGQMQHQLNNAKNHQYEYDGEDQSQCNEVAGFALAEIALAIFSALHAESCSGNALSHLLET